jgi:hypothetical protein
MALALALSGIGAAVLVGPAPAQSCAPGEYAGEAGACTDALVPVDHILVDKSDRRMWAFCRQSSIWETKSFNFPSVVFARNRSKGRE